jgi:hypothetical protein
MSQTSITTAATDVETVVRCGRCQSFIFALIALCKPQRIRGYCKRCGHRWTQTVRPIKAAE